MAYDPLGFQIHNVSGSLVFLVGPTVTKDGSPEKRETVEIAVVNDHWDVSTSLTRIGGVDSLILNGRPAAIQAIDYSNHDFPAVPSLIKAQLPDATVLNVLDDSTNGELRDVSVVRSIGTFRHPGFFDTSSIASSGDSPVTISVRRTESGLSTQEMLWVGAPAHAWDHIFVDHSLGGKRFVRLKAGADLELTLLHASPDVLSCKPAALVREVDDIESALGIDPGRDDGRCFALKSNTTQIDGLWENTFAIDILIERNGASIPLGHAVAQLRAAETTRVSIDVQGPNQGTETDVTDNTMKGRLFIDLSWNMRCSLSIEGLESKNRDRRLRIPAEDMKEVASGTFLWDAGSLPLGTYSITITPLQMSRVVTLDALTDLIDILVPQPADVSLAVMNSSSGDSVQPQTLSWRYVGPSDGAERDSWKTIPRVEGSSVYRFRAPSGTVEVWCADPLYRDQRKSFNLPPGINSLRLSVEPACGLVLRFSDIDNGVVIPARHIYASLIDTKLSGKEKEAKSSLFWERDRVTIIPSAPGSYRVDVSPIDGYEDVSSFEVQIDAGRLLEREVQLRRKH